MKKAKQKQKSSVRKNEFEGAGFPEGHVKGHVKKIQRLELDPTRKEFFLNCPAEKIIIADEIFSIDGQGFTFAGLFLSKDIVTKAPKAIILKKDDIEFLSGLVAAQSFEPSIQLPFFVWSLSEDFLEEIKDNDIVTIRIDGKKAVVRILR